MSNESYGQQPYPAAAPPQQAQEHAAPVPQADAPGAPAPRESFLTGAPAPSKPAPPTSVPAVWVFSLRELILVGIGVVLTVLSFFSIYELPPFVFGSGSIGYLPIWTQGLAAVVAAAALVAATALLVLRRLVPSMLALRVGSFGTDQFASIAFVSYAVVMWGAVFAGLGAGVVTWAAWVSGIVALGGVFFTVAAPFVPPFRYDFDLRGEVPATRAARVAPTLVAAPRAPKPPKPAPQQPGDPSAAYGAQPGQPYGQPAYGQPAAYGQPGQYPAPGQPQYGQAHPQAYGQQSGQPAPAFGQPAPAYGAPVPGAPVPGGQPDAAAPASFPQGDAPAAPTDDPGAAPLGEPAAPAPDETATLPADLAAAADDEAAAPGAAEGQGPVGAPPVEPVADGAAGDTAPERVSGADAPAATPADGAPADNAQAPASADAPVDAAADETPADETPAEEAPADETATDETPAEETSADGTPADQIPADDGQHAAAEPLDVDTRVVNVVDVAAAAGADASADQDTVLRTPVADQAQGQPAAQTDPGALPVTSAQPFWALAPVERDVVDQYGAPLFRIGPTAWALVLEERGNVFVVRHDDGRVGYLYDTTGVTRG